jgi:coproporphyrinogen III oxidase-like Fe-S oxidoreductase
LTHLLRVALCRSFQPFTFSNKTKPDFNYSLPNIGMYLHIPFCRTICSFCPYYKVVYDAELAKRYVAALVEEIRMGKSTGERSDIISLYVGGGTPALLLKHFSAILETIKDSHNLSGNIGMELHPDALTEENIGLLRTLGFDMVSMYSVFQ